YTRIIMVKMSNLRSMTKILSTAEVKARLSESIDLALQEGYVVITRYGKPVAALVSYEDIRQLQRLRSARQRGGLANLSENWEDSEELAEELHNILDERT
ncbi:MAG: type II toxin-antitoxin system Phd/YefM family antitoxin, partial [Microcystis sp.]